MNKKLFFKKFSKNSLIKGTTILLLALTMSVQNTTVFASSTINAIELAQQREVTLNYTNERLVTVLSAIRDQSGIGFVFEEGIEAEAMARVSINVENVTVKEALDALFKNIVGYRYSIDTKSITIHRVKTNAASQNEKISVNGRVVNENNEPIAGATVLVEGTSIGAITDGDGAFMFNANSGARIIVSYIGYVEQIVTATGGEQTIKMAPDALVVEDIVVTGFQTLSKERATGSFDTVGEDMLERPTSSIQESIIGNISGIQMIDHGWNSDEQTMIIRGLTSLGSNAKPLIVVDGFAIEGSLSSLNPNDIESITVLKDAAAASIWGARSANGVVVVTTKQSKKGNVEVELNAFVKMEGKMNLDYANPLATSAETIEYEKLAWDNNLFNRYTPLSDTYNAGIYSTHGRKYSAGSVLFNEAMLGYISQSELDSELARLSSLNNHQQIYDNIISAPVTQQYNLSVKGGSERMSNVFTAMFDKQTAPFKGNSDQRYTFNYRTNIELFKGVTLNVSSMYQYDQSNFNEMSLATIQNMSPYDMLLDDSGNYLHVQNNLYLPIVDRYITDQGVEFPYSNFAYNPLQNMLGTNGVSKNSNARIQAGLDIKIIKGLTYSTKFQYEMVNSSSETVYDESTYKTRLDVNMSTKWNGNSATTPTPWYATGSTLTGSSSEVTAWNFRNQLTFDRTFAEKHRISVIAGTEVSERFYLSKNNPTYYGYNPDLYSFTTPPGGVATPTNPMFNMFGAREYYVTSAYPTIDYGDNLDKYFSLYFNGAYTFDDKYTVSGSVRNDASNLISSDPTVRYSPFWSIGGSWQIAKEEFMKKHLAVDRLILRATYGFNGNVDKSTSVEPLISIWGYNANTGANSGVISNYGNPYLSWEKTGSLDIGVDFSLWNGALHGKIDYYNKQGRDLISTVAISNVYGSDNQKVNAVNMYNKGIEITLGTTLRKNGLVWSGNLSFAYNKNMITKLYKDRATLANRIYGPTSGWEYAEGYNANTLWSFAYGGMQNVGGVTQPVIVDKNGENPSPMTIPTYSFDSYDYLIGAGTSVAPYTLGFNSALEYKNLRLSFIITGYFGHVYKRTGFNYPTMSTGVGNINSLYSEVKNGNPNEIIPLPSADSNWMYPSQLSSYAGIIDYLYVSAANIRFQEVNLTYRFSRRLLNKIGLSSASIYAQVNNLGVIAFNGYGEDPMYPMGRIKPEAAITIGTKINF